MSSTPVADDVAHYAAATAAADNVDDDDDVDYKQLIVAWQDEKRFMNGRKLLTKLIINLLRHWNFISERSKFSNKRPPKWRKHLKKFSMSREESNGRTSRDGWVALLSASGEALKLTKVVKLLNLTFTAITSQASLHDLSPELSHLLCVSSLIYELK